jgi:hypothetical protein
MGKLEIIRVREGFATKIRKNGAKTQKRFYHLASRERCGEVNIAHIEKTSLNLVS